MQGINLARRPFVNRRPVLRLAVLLWIAGTALAVHNVRQYWGHWQGTSVYRQRLTEVEGRVREERDKLGLQDQALAKVRLASQNRRTVFLNQLITYRTFPWSALFDDLEEVLPLDVRLVSVRPNVKLSAEPEAPRRRRRANSRRPRSSRAATGEGAAAGEGERTNEAGEGAGTTGEQAREAREEVPLASNEVVLKLGAVARTEEALLELIEALYDDPSFRDPFVPGESLQPDGSTQFSVNVVYLTRRPDPAPEEAPVIAEQPPAEGALEPEAGSATAPASGGEIPEAGPEAVAAGESRTAAGAPSRTAAGPSRLLEPEDETAATSRAAPSRSTGITERGVAGRGRTDPASRAAEGGTARRETRRRGTATPTGRSRQRTVPGFRPGTATPEPPEAPGSGTPGRSGTPGGATPSTTPGRPGPSGAPEPSDSGDPGRSSDPPDFVQPPASATPRLRRSARRPWPEADRSTLPRTDVSWEALV